MKKYLLLLPQLALIALYNWIFFSNDISTYAANSWWAYVLLHVAFVVEIVALCFLKGLKEMPIIKKHHIWAFTVVFAIQFIFDVIFALVKTIELNLVIILSGSALLLELILFGVLFLVQRHREKNGSDEEDDGKPKSQAILDLKELLSNRKKWNISEDLGEITALTRVVDMATKNTSDEIADIEKKVQSQVKALKKYIKNGSEEDAKKVANTLMDLLSKREERIRKVEEN